MYTIEGYSSIGVTAHASTHTHTTRVWIWVDRVQGVLNVLFYPYFTR
jgi:hypothetical protein